MFSNFFYLWKNELFFLQEVERLVRFSLRGSVRKSREYLMISFLHPKIFWSILDDMLGFIFIFLFYDMFPYLIGIFIILGILYDVNRNIISYIYLYLLHYYTKLDTDV